MCVLYKRERDGGGVCEVAVRRDEWQHSAFLLAQTGERRNVHAWYILTSMCVCLVSVCVLCCLCVRERK